MKRGSILIFLLLVVILVACDDSVTGMEIKTTIRLDGSGATEFGVGFLPNEDEESGDAEIECGGVDADAPPGSTSIRQQRGDEIWCVTTIPTNSVQELNALFTDFGEEIIAIDCMHFVDSVFVYNADLFTGADLSDPGEGGDGYILWQVTVPGEVTSHNAHTQEGNTMSWMWSASSLLASLPINLRINVPEGESCPGGAVDLNVFIQEDGTGWADLVMPIPLTDEDLTPALQAQLEGMGWTIKGASSPYDGPGEIKATREYDSVDGFNQIIQSVPGFAGTQASMDLKLQEDLESGLQIAEFRSAFWDMNTYSAYWESQAEGVEVPTFRFKIDPPGFHEEISGKWTNPDILFTEWTTADPTKVIALSFRSIWDPDRGPYTAEDVRGELDALIDRFLVETPIGQVVNDPSFIQNGLAGIFPAGWVNNWTGGGYACGDYQTIVLNWLDGIRRHPNPQIRAQLKGLDYGPVQAYSGGHQAVAVFPRGTDWKVTGTMFDPWPEQIPRVFTMEEWRGRFPRGIGAGQGAENYPHIYGGDPLYRNEPLPVNERLHTRQIGVNSPVNVMVVAADGRRIGMLEDGTIVNEIPNADFYPTPKGDGTTHWQFGLPPGEYEVDITGTGSGDYHVMVGDGQGTMVKYEAQNIAPGEQVNLPVTQDSLEQPMITATGEQLMPTYVTDDNVEQIDFGSPIGDVVTGSEAAGDQDSPDDFEVGDESAGDDWRDGGLLGLLEPSRERGMAGVLGAGLLGIVCCLVVLAGIGALLYFFVGRK